MDADVVLVNKVKIMAPDLCHAFVLQIDRIVLATRHQQSRFAGHSRSRRQRFAMCRAMALPTLPNMRSRCFWKSATMSAGKPKAACARAQRMAKARPVVLLAENADLPFRAEQWA